MYLLNGNSRWRLVKRYSIDEVEFHTVLESLICRLEKATLLWVHGRSFSSSQPKEGRIERRQIFLDKMSSLSSNLH